MQPTKPTGSALQIFNEPNIDASVLGDSDVFTNGADACAPYLQVPRQFQVPCKPFEQDGYLGGPIGRPLQHPGACPPAIPCSCNHPVPRIDHPEGSQHPLQTCEPPGGS